jgi:hypothetical protein
MELRGRASRGVVMPHLTIVLVYQRILVPLFTSIILSNGAQGRPRCTWYCFKHLQTKSVVFDK